MSPSAIELPDHQMLALSRSALAALRSALLRDADIGGAGYLQQAGYAGSEAVYRSFREWLRGRIAAEPGELELDEFAELASGYFRDMGWGSLRLGALRDAVATVDSDDWGESDPESALAYPACHLTTGMLAGFFGHVASTPLAVLEVECRSMGSPRCRFLLGTGAVMNHVYHEIERGVGYEEAVAGVE
ncbi:MAG: V4R domain-containing protein [Gemmatimonadaceae bacterium]